MIFLQAYAQPPYCPPPASQGDLSEAEDIVGHKLPEGVRAACQLGNGEAKLVEQTGFERDPGIFSAEIFYSAQKVIYEYQAWEELLNSGDLEIWGTIKMNILFPCPPALLTKIGCLSQVSDT